MKYILVIIFFVLCGLSLSAQHEINIYGYLIDKTDNSPIPNAHIKIAGNDKGTTSNIRGFYSINTNSLPCTLNITHVRYKPKTIIITSENQLHKDILLEEQQYELSEIEITTPKPVNLVKNKLYDVKDYEFIDTNLVLLAWCYKEKINPWLILMTPDGDTITTQHVNANGSIYKDCLDSLYIVNKDTAYGISIKNNRFYITNYYSAESFLDYIEQCVTELNGVKYLKQYYYNNQVLSYYSVKNENDKPNEFRIIADYVGLRMLVDRDRFHAMGSSKTTDADLRFEEMCFFDPIFAPLVKIDNNICIFNYVDAFIEFFDSNNHQVEKIPIEFHKNRNWKEEIFVDQIKNKAYTLFKKSGISKIYEINLSTGKLENYVVIPGYTFIEKIKINNGNVYFLYRTNEPNDLMKLYKLPF
ncbi:MAG: hypothetical protein Kow0068_07010 [Marinilabiliales bacterium]